MVNSFQHQVKKLLIALRDSQDKNDPIVRLVEVFE